MSTDAYLWAIFALLFLALVLVVVTARRGPWSKPKMKPCVPVQCPDEEETVIESYFTVIELDPRVDPLWGKNRPTVADLMKDEW